MTDAQDLSELEKDPRLFLYTSLTAGSSHIITATSRLETILKANKVPFQAVDTATDGKARRLWARRAAKKKLPGLVKEGFVIGDLEDIEEWNEFGELKQNIGPVPGVAAAVPAPKLPVNPTATAGTANVGPAPLLDSSKRVALPGAAEIAARNNPLPKSSPDDTVRPETMSSAPAAKEKSIAAATAAADSAAPAEQDETVDHPSVPPSAIPSGVATPAEVSAAEPKAAKPSAVKSAAAEPSAAVPKAAEPEIAESKPAEIEPAESKAAEPTAAGITVEGPTPAEPATAETMTSESTTEEPPKAKPAAGEPTTAGPAKAEPTTAKPTTVAQIENTPPPPAAGPTSQHRGSEIKEAPPDHIKKIEDETAIPESTEDEEGGEADVAKGVQGQRAEDEGEAVQEQKAAEPADAGKSVGD